jgi:hypothetical protein
MKAPEIGLDPTFPVMIELGTSVIPDFDKMAKEPAAPRLTGAWAVDPTGGVVVVVTGGVVVVVVTGGVVVVTGGVVVVTGGVVTTTGGVLGVRTACRFSASRLSLARVRRWSSPDLCSPGFAMTAVVPATRTPITARGMMGRAFRRKVSPRSSQYAKYGYKTRIVMPVPQDLKIFLSRGVAPSALPPCMPH